jgi:hypothetical protein
MSGRQRESLIHREYARHVACFRAFKRIRNKALAHREIIDIDWQVIEHCAGPALAFSQRCLNTAIVAWDMGAREPKGRGPIAQELSRERLWGVLAKPAGRRSKVRESGTGAQSFVDHRDRAAGDGFAM